VYVHGVYISAGAKIMLTDYDTVRNRQLSNSHVGKYSPIEPRQGAESSAAGQKSPPQASVANSSASSSQVPSTRRHFAA
jgi:hypothetical protein